MKTEEKLPADLQEKVDEVRLDNAGKPEHAHLTDKEVAADVNKINPDCNTLDRG
jgi:hypothetical protein